MRKGGKIGWTCDLRTQAKGDPYTEHGKRAYSLYHAETTFETTDEGDTGIEPLLSASRWNKVVQEVRTTWDGDGKESSVYVGPRMSAN